MCTILLYWIGKTFMKPGIKFLPCGIVNVAEQLHYPLHPHPALVLEDISPLQRIHPNANVFLQLWCRVPLLLDASRGHCGIFVELCTKMVKWLLKAAVLSHKVFPGIGPTAPNKNFEIPANKDGTSEMHVLYRVMNVCCTGDCHCVPVKVFHMPITWYVSASCLVHVHET